MDLRDRFELRNLIAAALQILVFLGVVVFGLLPPSLGWKLVLPTLVFLPAWAWLVWLTLDRPWIWDDTIERGPWGRPLGWNQGRGVLAGTLAVCGMHAILLRHGKHLVERWATRPADAYERYRNAESARAWADDTFGASILADGHWALVLAALMFVVFTRWMLPR